MALPRFMGLLAWLAVACSIQGCSPGAEAPHIVVLRLAHNQVVGHPYDQAAQRFAARVDSATNGAVTIKIFPSSQLGDSSEQLEGLLLGTLDLTVSAFAFASEFVPEFGLFSAPYLFEDAGHFGAVFGGRVGRMLDTLALEKAGISLLATLTSGERAFFNSVRPVDAISDLRGLKVRVMSGRADALTWEAFGAIPTPMPYSEVYSALQAGVIDGAENDPASILNNRFYESCRYLSLTNHMVLPMGIFAGERMRRLLGPDVWEVVAREARKTAEWQQQFMESQNEAAIRTMEDGFGVVVSRPDRRALADRVRAIQGDVAIALRATTLLEEIRLAGNTE